MPLSKVLGTGSIADLMIKHLQRDMVRDACCQNDPTVQGRSRTQGGGVEPLSEPLASSIEDRFVRIIDLYAKRRGGDLWHSRRKFALLAPCVACQSSACPWNLLTVGLRCKPGSAGIPRGAADGTLAVCLMN